MRKDRRRRNDMKLFNLLNKTNKMLSLALMLFISNIAIGQTDVDNINRSVVALNADGGIYISWALLTTDPTDIGFDIYRITDQGSPTKLNDGLIVNSTNYLDATANTSASNEYYVVPVLDGQDQPASKTVATWDQEYLEVSLNIPSGGTTPDGNAYTYSANDASVADLDGDGELEIVLKWSPSNSKDNSQSGYTGPTILEGLEFDGTSMWKINLGINIRSGAHYTQFMVYDLDGDGIAEVACKTADGTTDNAGTIIGDENADYRNGSGYVLSGPEFLTVFSGQTGNILHTINYNPARGDVSAWGDSYGNRVDRFNAAIAYFDGVHPYLMMARGYYTRTVLVAYRFVGGELDQEWIFDTKINGLSNYEGQGNHQLSVADVDGDGKDEIIFGAMVVDHDGNGLWTTGLGHGDALHVTDLIPERDGLEIFGPHEGTHNPGVALKDGKSGEVLWQSGNADVGRAVAGDIDPNNYGAETWWYRDQVRSATNLVVTSGNPSVNFLCWWDGDLSRELMDNISVRKWNYQTQEQEVLLEATGCSSNNSTKSTPALQADILGDWREEVMWRLEDNSALRIYTTNIPTEYKLVTLMQDRQYREAIAWQNVGYNQPPHPSFYLGTGMFDDKSTIPPSPPSDLTLEWDTSAVELSWVMNYESDFDSYMIYRSVSTNDNFEVLEQGITDAFFSDETIILDSSYYYYVVAKDLDGNTSSPSDTLFARPTARPAAPVWIVARAGKDQTMVFWEESTANGVEGYNVYASETSGEGFVKLNSELLSSPEFNHTGLSETNTYYYVATAVGQGESFYSEETSVVPGEYKTVQAESGVLSEDGGWKDSDHEGYNGTGFVNFNSSGSLELKYLYNDEPAGLYRVVFRYALGNDPRTGQMTLNDSTFNYTMQGTGGFAEWLDDSITLNLNHGFNNTIVLTATGGDYANLDQVTITDQNINPELFDCNGVYNGSAFEDDCGVCVSGNTGYDPCNINIATEVPVLIKAEHSQLCLGVGEDFVEQQECGRSAQMWHLESGSATGAYKIKNLSNDLYLSMIGSYTNLADEATEWRIEDSEGVHRLVVFDNINSDCAILRNSTESGDPVRVIVRNNTSSAHLFYFEDVVLSADDIEATIDIYPNPVSDGIINVRSKNASGSTLKVVGIDGQLIKTVIIGSNSQSINLKGIRPGLYLINFEREGEIIDQKKILINK